ncbi:MAG: 4-hydroxy-tetrahydrodipicolinate reductase [Methanotrichaceae archaeon]|nr:4-hydroxy-tetrahydrodipicolinate reductase [Methanotrichaceae archaeon]
MTVRVAVVGCRGRMGRLILEEVRSSPLLELNSAFDLVDIGELLFDGVVVSPASDMRDVLDAKRPDVLIDFTTPAATLKTAKTAAELGVDLVIGTTGLGPDERESMIEAISGRVAAVISPNFSIGVNLFWRLIESAAIALRDYDVELIEFHHNQKKDAPSGTADKAVKVLQKAMGIDEVVYGREGPNSGPRGREIGVHAVRAGDIVGDHIVLFAGAGERLEIKHQAHSRTAFASGAIRAAIWVAGASPGIYTMDDVLS